MPLANIVQEGATVSAQLSSIVTGDMMNGVFNEIVGLLPICIPVMVSFIALRKGIGFVKSTLQSA